mgnify:CR=1 FL=1
MNIAILPARSGSKRIKNKNIHKFNNKPFISHTINFIKKTKIFNQIIVSTDSKKIADISIQEGAEVPFLRSKKLSNDTCTTHEVIVDVIKKFKCNVGLSDHTLGIGVAVSSIAYGASVIEKHFVLDRSKGGVDSSFSLEPQEMKNLCIEVKNAWQAKGKIFYGVTKSEKKSLRFRRSLYFTRDLSKGQKISENDIKSLRPAIGLKPKFLKKIINKKTSKKIKSGTPVNWHLIKI